MKASARTALLALAAVSCGRPGSPEEAVSATLESCLEILREHVDPQAARPRLHSAEFAPLRRELRAALDGRVDLPEGFGWGSPAVDSATATLARHLLQIARHGYAAELSSRDDAREPPRAVVRVSWTGPQGRRLDADLRLELRGRRWIAVEPFEEPR